MATKIADSYLEALQKDIARFRRETGKQQHTVKELGVWAVKNGHWEPPADLVLRKCCEDFSRALREQHFEDVDGSSIRVNHVARIIRGDRQLHLWADIRNASHEHIETAFHQRRKQVVGECRQLNRDNKYYRSIHPDRPAIQIPFDFRDDVAEGEFSGDYPDGPSI
jgi:hypothetical protein